MNISSMLSASAPANGNGVVVDDDGSNANNNIAEEPVTTSTHRPLQSIVQSIIPQSLIEDDTMTTVTTATTGSTTANGHVPTENEPEESPNDIDGEDVSNDELIQEARAREINSTDPDVQKYLTRFTNKVNLVHQFDDDLVKANTLLLFEFDHDKNLLDLQQSKQYADNYILRLTSESVTFALNSGPFSPSHTSNECDYRWGSTREFTRPARKPSSLLSLITSTTADGGKRAAGGGKRKTKAVGGKNSVTPIAPKPADGAEGNGTMSTSTSTTGSTTTSTSTRPKRTRTKKRSPYDEELDDAEAEAAAEDEEAAEEAAASAPPLKRARRKTALANGKSSTSLVNSEIDKDGEPSVRIKLKLNLKHDTDDEDEEEEEEDGGGDDDDSNTNSNKKKKGTINKASATQPQKVTVKEQRMITRQYDNVFLSIWKDLARKDGPKVSRMIQQTTQAKAINMKKTCILAAREAKRWQLRNNKNQKDLTTKARRAMREMFNFWKRNERTERDLRKKHEKELIDKAKREEEEREARRQLRKLNFLITQTELYSHFIGKKIRTDEFEGKDSDPKLTKVTAASSTGATAGGGHHYDKYEDVKASTTSTKDFSAIDFDNEDDEALTAAAAANAQQALQATRDKAKEFDDFKNPDTNGEEMNFQNPTLMGDITISQPKSLKCTLKEYQIKGLNWLANLYEQGINGILADEMGLGKTVQSISVLAYLAETHNIWGPFLVVTPASTLHNWQQEITKFVPEFKVLPYWGNAKDRKVLRKFWDRKSIKYGRDAPFHVLVTSYQLVVADAAYFRKMRWQYMILDEAQAIKSSQSSRWKVLLSFSCRNRLLLTGTPIQNSMQELWALLHFIMPSLFDSHDEFSDWFSKDIESHAQSNTQLNEEQLRRLHMILKPFMLRRIKKNVQSELGDKVEIDIFCNLTNRQKKYYQMLKSQISIMDILDQANSNSRGEETTESLINLVMQFRKVCNHPDLFERADVKSPFSFGSFSDTSSFLRETNDLEMSYSAKNHIEYNLPRLIYDDLLTPSFNNNVGSKPKINSMFDIYHPSNTVTDSNSDNTSFGWLSFVDVSGGELYQLSHKNVLERALDLKEYTDINYDKVNRLKYVYDDYDDDDAKFIPKSKLLLINEYNNDYAQVNNSIHLKELHTVRNKVYTDMYVNILDPAAAPIATAPPIVAHCSSQSFYYGQNDVLFNPQIRSSLMPLSLNTEYTLMNKGVPVDQFPKSNMLPPPINHKIDYSNIRMPSMDRFISESGKLARLDSLLNELKMNDHRVLIYFQMTRMMDLMEEYLTYRQHKFIRLDGSSKLDDRRDLVHDWQTKPDIFIFLLSTRAGGLGINLTAADTVIFYDSDWNPTIDSQAMDRAHRLGQTRQVTVYRLLAKGTIEERMRDRAKQKEQVQQVVMEGKATMVSKKEEAANKKKDAAFLLLGNGDEAA
ncbi:putative DNA helicase ino80 [Scheffersomyces spartinae]|uniref:Chromatin-remodeling ATPase INO80 n=1 Tax=Scheffersomyces spartinae TaxID=45513 RepID=A0A9P7VAG3_9ASCO|nr:putative DNA helicase ino80 [Scheffersomyces spartinae]KAG7194208.1 putative DNA helicase ino80 [Scheffersomyces spartinae]